MALEGDFAALEQIRADLATLASSAVRAEINANLVETARSLVATEFETSTDPYGRPWLPLKSRDGQPLLDTGRLRNSFGGDGSDATAFRFGTDVVYAALHQYGGTVKHGARATPRAKTGRFLSHSRAAKSTGKALAITFLPEHDITVPARQMMPEGDLPDAWLAQFRQVVEEEIKSMFGGAE